LRFHDVGGLLGGYRDGDSEITGTRRSRGANSCAIRLDLPAPELSLKSTAQCGYCETLS
jgi:hypothetical protein